MANHYNPLSKANRAAVERDAHFVREYIAKQVSWAAGVGASTAQLRDEMNLEIDYLVSLDTQWRFYD